MFPIEVIRHIYSFLPPMEVRYLRHFDERVCNDCWEPARQALCTCEFMVPFPLHFTGRMDQEAGQMVLWANRINFNLTLPPVFPTIYLRYRNQWEKGGGGHALRWKFCRRHWAKRRQRSMCEAEWLNYPQIELRYLSSHFEMRRHQEHRGELCGRFVCPVHPLFIACSRHSRLRRICENCLFEILRGNPQVYLRC